MNDDDTFRLIDPDTAIGLFAAVVILAAIFEPIFR